MHQYDDIPDSVCKKLQGLSINYALENGLIDVGDDGGRFIIKSEDDPNVLFGIVDNYKIQFSLAVTNKLISDESSIEDLGDLVFYRFKVNGEYQCRLGMPAYLNLVDSDIVLNSEYEQDEELQDYTDSIVLKPQNYPPHNPRKGTLYFDATMNKLRCFLGTNWQNCW